MIERPKKLKIRYLRRITQLIVLVGIILIPIYSQNPMQWSPSRIVLGQLPPPTVFSISGDTWTISFGDFKLMHPLAFIDFLVSTKRFYMPALVAVLIPLLITLVLGRVFCSWLCPVGFILELNQKIHRFLGRFNNVVKFRDLRLTLFLLLLGVGFFFAVPVLSVFDPPHILGREFMYYFTHKQLSITGVAFIVTLIIFEMLFVRRAWCNYLCPSGGGLSLLSWKRLLNIRMNKELCIKCGKCDDACPYYLQPMKLAEGESINWLKCDNCALCRDVCPTSAIDLAFYIDTNKVKKKEE
ncbi:MAG: 4Fe-4S binding protein [Nitrospirae bacterium]|nr:4Fe-4S binding protein [Nitrospirota bacterium]